MTKETWIATWIIIGKLTPTVRVDLCLAGEPTLHPEIVPFLKIARKLAPKVQLQITTNGTMLRKGAVTYKELLEAGANIIYTDMYGPKEQFLQMARNSKFPFYEYYDKPEGAPSPWTYYGPELKLIVLQEQPENWPSSRLRAGLLGTWYNHLDWKAAAKFGLKPVTSPPVRRCNQPYVYVPVHASGKYLLCCQDNWGETAGLFGTVHDGVKGFYEYWYGKLIQTVRWRLRHKNRVDSSWCSRCCITFSRCDYIHWEEKEVRSYLENGKWKQLPSEILKQATFQIPKSSKK